MTPVIAIFGAGPGLGTALARRFAKEGYRVALVARNSTKLATLASDLTAEGIEAAAFPHDLSTPSNGRAATNAILAHYGRIDVVSYQPLPAGTAFTPATTLTAENLTPLTNLFFLTPVEVAATVVPTMVTRGSGSFIVTGGFTAADPQPFISGIGPAMAAIRNYIHSLHGEIATAGVHAGVVTLAALIKHSESYNAITPTQLAEITGGTTGLTVLDPDDLAETYWQLHTTRAQLEYRYPTT
ncbi:SDR family NAD(P)-dependent oxidoreductase [Lentzea sp. JNUCC 0626]|uniref:SDR family NAD(P)-dependent oxidoreductase n=1 Tax=Lentzea sp. JNUCC 0626 TaxID=3367513 RepID=UPI0037495096